MAEACAVSLCTFSVNCLLGNTFGLITYNYRVFVVTLLFTHSKNLFYVFPTDLEHS